MQAALSEHASQGRNIAAHCLFEHVAARFRRVPKELRAIVTSQEISKRIIADGGDPVATTPEQYAANLARGEAKWAELVKKIGLVIN